jgi:hypothetical protein
MYKALGKLFAWTSTRRSVAAARERAVNFYNLRRMAAAVKALRARVERRQKSIGGFKLETAYPRNLRHNAQRRRLASPLFRGLGALPVSLRNDAMSLEASVWAGQRAARITLSRFREHTALARRLHASKLLALSTW